MRLHLPAPLPGICTQINKGATQAVAPGRRPAGPSAQARAPGGPPKVPDAARPSPDQRICLKQGPADHRLCLYSRVKVIGGSVATCGMIVPAALYCA
jgi:hypothetical protein